jgi:type IV fimbrial biogenesis protein FimT
LRQSGFSLQELLTVLALGGVLTAGAAGMHGLVVDQRQSAEVNAVLGLFALARSDAITRRSEVVVCPSANGSTCERVGSGEIRWEQGIMVFDDLNGNGVREDSEPVARVHDPAHGVAIKSSPARPRVIYHPNGMSPSTAMTLTVCDLRGRRPARYVVLYTTGRARVSSSPGDGRIDEIHERCP